MGKPSWDVKYPVAWTRSNSKKQWAEVTAQRKESVLKYKHLHGSCLPSNSSRLSSESELVQPHFLKDGAEGTLCRRDVLLSISPNPHCLLSPALSGYSLALRTRLAAAYSPFCARIYHLPTVAPVIPCSCFSALFRLCRYGSHTNNVSLFGQFLCNNESMV